MRLGGAHEKGAKGCTQKLKKCAFPRRTISRVMKLTKRRPQECKIVAENKDGSICAKVPISWIRINPPKQFTDEQKKEMAYRLNGNDFNRANTGNEID